MRAPRKYPPTYRAGTPRARSNSTYNTYLLERHPTLNSEPQKIFITIHNTVTMTSENTPTDATSLSSKLEATTKEQPKKKNVIRMGANGVLLKNFETVLHDVFSSSSSCTDPCQQALNVLSPQYSKLPPFLKELEETQIMEIARAGWWDEDEGASSPQNVHNNCNNDDEHHGSNGTSSPLLSPPWPFDKRTNLPSFGCVRGASDCTHRKPKKTKTGKDKGGVGDIYYNHERAWRKEMQLANMIQCVLALLPDHVRHQSAPANDDKSKSTRKYRIVDFAGGTGHLAVPLALLLPQCEVVCVDLKKWSLDLLHRRVDGVEENEDGDEEEISSLLDKNTQNGQHKKPCNSNIIQVSQKVPNLSTYFGSIQSYADDFDIGISLHACGEASDCVLRKCLEQKASWVVCSCCCGKLRREALNPYIFQSTGGNEKEISYPQSKILSSFMNVTVDNDDGDDNARRFDEIARAADYSELGDVRKPRNACRRAAKSLVEWDRLLYCKEHGDTDGCVSVVLTRMVPWEASTKNDILIGWYDPSCNPYRRRGAACEDTACDNMSNEDLISDMPPDDPASQVDFQIALRHLFGGSAAHENGKDTVPDTNIIACDQNDWSAEEVKEIKTQLETFVNDCAEGTLRFHRGMGPRKRKLIHYVAEIMGLRHWGEGKKDAEKIVVVAR
jgi:hypothetical protein